MFNSPRLVAFRYLKGGSERSGETILNIKTTLLEHRRYGQSGRAYLSSRNLVDGRVFDFHRHLAVDKVGQIQIDELVSFLFPLFNRYRSNFDGVSEVQDLSKRNF